MNHCLSLGYKEQSNEAYHEGALILNESLHTCKSHTLRFVDDQIWNIVSHGQSLHTI